MIVCRNVQCLIQASSAVSLQSFQQSRLRGLHCQSRTLRAVHNEVVCKETVQCMDNERFICASGASFFARSIVAKDHYCHQGMKLLKHVNNAGAGRAYRAEGWGTMDCTCVCLNLPTLQNCSTLSHFRSHSKRVQGTVKERRVLVSNAATRCTWPGLWCCKRDRRGGT